MWTIIGLLIVATIIIWFKFFAEDRIISSKYHTKKRKEGVKYWKWATTKPYFTFKKIIYWIFLATITAIYMYIGFNLPI